MSDIHKIQIVHRKDGSYSIDEKNMDKLKTLYSSLMERKGKADKYFNNNGIPEAEKDSYKFSYIKMIHQIVAVEILLKLNFIYGDKIIFNGEITGR